MKAGPIWGTRAMPKYLRKVQSTLYTVCTQFFQQFCLFASSMILLCLCCWQHSQPHSFVLTNVFLFSFPISSFTNGFWLCFDSYIRCLDSSSLHRHWAQGLHYGFLWLCLYIQVEVWTWVNPSSTYSYVWGHESCNLLALIFIWVDIVYILVFALSLLVKSGHLSSLASLSIVARARPTFYKMTAFMFEASIEWPFLITPLSHFGSLHVSEGSP